MRQHNDWRLTNQERYLKGVTLKWKRYVRHSDSWEHDHCESCWSEFTEGDAAETLHAGYATEENYRWIFGACYEDCLDIFERQSCALKWP